VKREMTEEKGLDPTSADKIGEYVKHRGAQSFDGLSAVWLTVE
jgi:histidyl-tRNA synthetase